MKQAIVTGATGFIGRHLIKVLAENGVKVTAVVRNVAKANWQYPSVQTVVCDLADMENLTSLIGSVGEDTVFYHLAWTGTAGDDRADARLQLQNVEYTLNALKAAQELHCECFVGAGSLMEYESSVAVHDETMSPGKANIYSTAKLTAHYMSKIMAADSDIRYVWPYITNAYAEDESSPRFLNTLVRNLLNNTPMQFSAATQLYDFIHAGDVAMGFYLAGKYGKNGRTYCVGSGNVKPLKEYIILTRDLVNKDYQLVFGDKPGISIAAEYFATQKLHDDTGFTPQIPFDEGIERMVAKMRSTT